MCHQKMRRVAAFWTNCRSLIECAGSSVSRAWQKTRQEEDNWLQDKLGSFFGKVGSDLLDTEVEMEEISLPCTDVCCALAALACRPLPLMCGE